MNRVFPYVPAHWLLYSCHRNAWSSLTLFLLLLLSPQDGLERALDEAAAREGSLSSDLREAESTAASLESELEKERREKVSGGWGALEREGRKRVSSAAGDEGAGEGGRGRLPRWPGGAGGGGNAAPNASPLSSSLLGLVAMKWAVRHLLHSLTGGDW